MFLPGIYGSQLYEASTSSPGTEIKDWEPEGNFDLIFYGTDNAHALHPIMQNGVSGPIYTKVGDVVAEHDGTKYYRSFMDDLDSFKSNGQINDWEPIAYDWRLSPDQILSSGKLEDGTRLSYLDATTSPYIIQELKHLASSSKTGKVTIVVHSNGGLIAKALMSKLGTTTTAQLIDKVILVGVPQAGTPEGGMAALLYGYGQGFPEDKWFLPENGLTIDGIGVQRAVSEKTTRAVAATSPTAFNFLPSSKYST